VADKHFFSDELNNRSKLWVPSAFRYDCDWDDEIWKKYHELESELHKIVYNILKVYKEYRSTIREILYI